MHAGKYIMHIAATDLGWFCVDVQSGGHAEFTVGQRNARLNVHDHLSVS